VIDIEIIKVFSKTSDKAVKDIITLVV